MFFKHHAVLFVVVFRRPALTIDLAIALGADLFDCFSHWLSPASHRARYVCRASGSFLPLFGSVLPLVLS